MFDKNELPSNRTLVRICMYFMITVGLGVSFSAGLDLMNEIFVVGVALTVANFGFSFVFVRHVVATHFTNQD